MTEQREKVYSERRRVLEGEDLHEQVHHFMDDTIDAYVAAGHAGTTGPARLASLRRLLRSRHVPDKDEHLERR